MKVDFSFLNTLMASRAVGTIRVSTMRSDLVYKRCGFRFDLRCNRDFNRFSGRECCRLAVFPQRAITPVEDEKPFIPEVEPSGAIDRVQDTESSVIHKDLNLLPSEFVQL